MASEATTIARPYAEAAYARAVETDKLDLWSDMLELLAVVSKDPLMAGLIASPKLSSPQMAELVVEIGGGRLTEEGKNLVQILAVNHRMSVLPEIASLFETLKSTHQGVLDVHIISAYAMKPAQEHAIAKSLKVKLGREIKITSEKDHQLIGGIRIKAGDMVIDGSIQGQLHQLANELAI